MNLHVQVQLRRPADPLRGYYTMYAWMPIGVKRYQELKGPDLAFWWVKEVYGICIRDLDEERKWE